VIRVLTRLFLSFRLKRANRTKSVTKSLYSNLVEPNIGKYAQSVGINLSVMKPSMNLVQLSGDIACVSAHK